MSKLTDVKDELAVNPAVRVVLINRKPRIISAYAGGFSDWVDIFVVPTMGLYSAQELQDFMMGLVSIKPTSVDHFRQHKPHGMSFGKLYFDEPIGNVVTTGHSTVTITDPDVDVPDEFKDNVHVVDNSSTEDLTRRTLLWVYPDDLYAHRALANQDVYATKDDLSARKGLRRYLYRS